MNVVEHFITMYGLDCNVRQFDKMQFEQCSLSPLQ